MPTTTQPKTYTIGQVAAMFNLSTYTLRYYDKEGLIPNLKKTQRETGPSRKKISPPLTSSNV